MKIAPHHSVAKEAKFALRSQIFWNFSHLLKALGLKFDRLQRFFVVQWIIFRICLGSLTDLNQKSQFEKLLKSSEWYSTHKLRKSTKSLLLHSLHTFLWRGLGIGKFHLSNLAVAKSQAFPLPWNQLKDLCLKTQYPPTPCSSFYSTLPSALS